SGPVTYQGKHDQLPYEGGSGLGKPLQSTVHSLRTDIPVYLGAEGPKDVPLAAEIADRRLPRWPSPKADGSYRQGRPAGAARAGGRDRRRVAAALVLPGDGRLLPAGAGRGVRPPGRAPQARRLRGGRRGVGVGGRRRGEGRPPPQAGHRPVRGRNGGEGGQLPP